MTNKKEGVIIRNTELKEKSDIESKTITILKCEEPIEVIGVYYKLVKKDDLNNVWYKIKNNKNEGWVFGSDIGFCPLNTSKGILFIKKEIEDVVLSQDGYNLYAKSCDIIYFRKKDKSMKTILSELDKTDKTNQIMSISFNDFNNDKNKELIIEMSSYRISLDVFKSIKYAYVFNSQKENLELIFYWYEMYRGSGILALEKSEFKKDDIYLEYVLSYNSFLPEKIDINGFEMPTAEYYYKIYDNVPKDDSYIFIKLNYHKCNNKYNLTSDNITLTKIRYYDENNNLKSQTTSSESIRLSNNKIEELFDGIINGKKVVKGAYFDLYKPFIYK